MGLPHLNKGLTTLNYTGNRTFNRLKVSFFCHRDTLATDRIKKKVGETARNLIAQDVNEFWVCGEGNFNWIFRMIISRFKEEFKHFIYVCYISAYNPSKFSKHRFYYCL